jgi:hypothetical protein
MSGTVTNQEQLSYVQAIPRPPGCSFSRSSGRYVIRADHICFWVSNWVAKRNHKQFILFMLWGGILALSLFGWRFVPQKGHSGWTHAVDLVGMMLDAIFGLTLFVSGATFVWDTLSNRTKIQRMKGEGAPAVSSMEAMRQVCGDGSVWGWFCPTAAFGDVILLEEAPGQGHTD